MKLQTRQLLRPRPSTPLELMAAASRRLRPEYVAQDIHRERARRLAERGDPERYIFEIFGWRATRDQKRLTQAYLDHGKFMAVGANASGKSAWLAALFVGWGFDALASLPAEDSHPQGAVILIVAPTGPAGIEAYQKHFLELGKRAQERERILPGWGNHSSKSVNWTVQAGRWYMRQITAPAKTGSDEVSHHALGAHHDNMMIWVEEVAGVHPAIIEAAKGRLRSATNKLGCSTNPTSATGLGYQLSQVAKWPTVYSSAVGRMGYVTGNRDVEPLEAHENIQERRPVFPGAVSHIAVEEDLRDGRHFEIRGRLWNPEELLLGEYREQVPTEDPPEGYSAPEPAAGDFPYALPSPGLKDTLGPREDGFPGHPAVEVLVIRPLTGTAYGRIVGGWPPIDPRSLFSAFMLAKAVELASRIPAPRGSPDVVGVDASVSDRGDEMIGVPWWGLPARELLELAWEARPGEGSSIQAGADVLMGLRDRIDGEYVAAQDQRPGVPAIIGEPVSLPVGDQGSKAAQALVDRWGTSPVYQVDHAAGAGVGSSLISLGCEVMWMHFGGGALPSLPGQTRAAFNARAMWAFDLADAVQLGLVAFCRDQQAHEDLIAMGAPEQKTRAAARQLGAGGQIEVYKVRLKEIIKKILGRSPDRGDAILVASARPSVPRWE